MSTLGPCYITLHKLPWYLNHNAFGWPLGDPVNLESPICVLHLQCQASFEAFNTHNKYSLVLCKVSPLGSTWALEIWQCSTSSFVPFPDSSCYYQPEMSLLVLHFLCDFSFHCWYFKLVSSWRRQWPGQHMLTLDFYWDHVHLHGDHQVSLLEKSVLANRKECYSCFVFSNTDRSDIWGCTKMSTNYSSVLDSAKHCARRSVGIHHSYPHAFLQYLTKHQHLSTKLCRPLVCQIEPPSLQKKKKKFRKQFSHVHMQISPFYSISSRLWGIVAQW